MKTLGKVLLVDDDPTSTFISAGILRRSGMVEDLAVARNGQEALEVVQQSKFDLILLDVLMPTMDGFEFLGALKGLQATTDIAALAVVMLTTSASEHDKENALRFPIVRGYINKPLYKETVTYLTSLLAEADGTSEKDQTEPLQPL